MANQKKDNVNKKVTFRLSDAQYLELVDQTTREDGSALMSLSEVCRKLVTKGKVVVVDQEIERYQAFVFNRFANNFNQLVKLLHTKNVQGELDDDVVLAVFSELHDLRVQFSQEMKPMQILKDEDR